MLLLIHNGLRPSECSLREAHSPWLWRLSYSINVIRTLPRPPSPKYRSQLSTSRDFHAICLLIIQVWTAVQTSPAMPFNEHVSRDAEDEEEAKGWENTYQRQGAALGRASGIGAVVLELLRSGQGGSSCSRAHRVSKTMRPKIGPRLERGRTGEGRVRT